MTSSDVAVAVVTVPIAPLLNTTTLLAATELKPKPLIVIVEALAAKLVLLLVITGITLATCRAKPLVKLLVVTTAVKLPTAVGFVDKVTVSAVAVAAVTVPTAPLLKATVLLPGVVSKPKPLIVTVLALASKLATLVVTVGVTVATCTATPLLTLLVVTTAVRLPAVVGLVDKVMVNEVVVAAVTVPTAPLLNTTVLRLAIGSKPRPVIVSVVALAAWLAVLAFNVGDKVATWTVMD